MTYLVYIHTNIKLNVQKDFSKKVILLGVNKDDFRNN
jgi:hypothetical protein